MKCAFVDDTNYIAYLCPTDSFKYSLINYNDATIY